MQHATAYAFRVALKLNSMLLQQQIWFKKNLFSFGGLTNFILKWISCGSEGWEYELPEFEFYNVVRDWQKINSRIYQR